MEDLTGRQFGPYQVVGPLGEGGMAAVYKAYHPATERYVALKVLPRHLAKDPQFLSRFQREAKLLAQMQHPHILPVFDHGQSEGFTYIVMPLVTGGTLADELRGRPLPLPKIRQIATQLADALNYAHGGLITALAQQCPN
jgi:serine/threonine-protein kinase